MAAFLHPDKMRDVENARECFEQVSSFFNGYISRARLTTFWGRIFDTIKQ